MFYEASAFNQDIGRWAVDSVTSMERRGAKVDVRAVRLEVRAEALVPEGVGFLGVQGAPEMSIRRILELVAEVRNRTAATEENRPGKVRQEQTARLKPPAPKHGLVARRRRRKPDRGAGRALDFDGLLVCLALAQGVAAVVHRRTAIPEAAGHRARVAAVHALDLRHVV